MDTSRERRRGITSPLKEWLNANRLSYDAVAQMVVERGRGRGVDGGKPCDLAISGAHLRSIASQHRGADYDVAVVLVEISKSGLFRGALTVDEIMRPSRYRPLIEATAVEQGAA